jgi:hypothetical protein
MASYEIRATCKGAIVSFIDKFIIRKRDGRRSVRRPHGNPGSFVKIELLKGGAVNRTITFFASTNSSSYNWKIPSN